MLFQVSDAVTFLFSDTENIRFVFAAVKDTILQLNLKEYNLVWWAQSTSSSSSSSMHWVIVAICTLSKCPSYFDDFGWWWRDSRRDMTSHSGRVCLAATAPVVAVGSKCIWERRRHLMLICVRVWVNARRRQQRHVGPSSIAVSLGRWRIQMCIYDNPSPAQAHRHDNARAAVVHCRLPACASERATQTMQFVNWRYQS